MRTVLILLGLFFTCMVVPAQISVDPLPPKTEKEKTPVTKYPPMSIMGYEEDVLLFSINPEVNSVEDFKQVENILAPYIPLSNVSISRVVSPKIKVKINDAYVDRELTDKVMGTLPEYEKKFHALYKLKIKKNEISLKEFQKVLSKEKNIIYVQKNYKYQETFEPNDPGYTSGKMWGVTATQTNLAWDLSEGNEVVVATIDTGIDYNHPDIVGNLWNNGSGYCGYDFSDQDDDPLDYGSHGTHIAGIIASVMDNNLGIAGVAPQVKIMAVKVFPNVFSEVLAQGIKYAADQGADIINNSWGLSYRRPDDPVVSAAIDYAYARGCTIVNSAGNSNDDAQHYFGANHPDVICVAGVNSSLEKVPTSNYGEVVDVAAPGEAIYSLQPGGTYQYSTGTSSAAAYVSGLAALIKGYNQDLTNIEIKQAIMDSASALAEPLFYNAGFMNSYNALSGGIIPSPPPLPVITAISAVDEEEDIIVNGENFIPGSMVVIEGNGIHEYATIISSQDNVIVVENQYAFGTYQVQVENISVMSNPYNLTINYVPLTDSPSIGIIPDIEEDKELFIYGNNFDPGALTVHITGNGFDEDAEINFICPTAVGIETYFLAGEYQITVFNGPVTSNTKTFRIHEMGTMPAPPYSIKNGNDSPFNWLFGTSGRDRINGYGGTDYIFGYGGDDILNGGPGSDVFVYGVDHGIDIIEDSSGEDLISIVGIEPEDVTPAVVGFDYILYVPNGRILVKDQFVEPNSVIDMVEFW